MVCTGRGYVSVYYIYTPSVLRSRRSVPPSGLRCPPDELVDLVAMLDWRIFAVLAAVCLYDGWVSHPRLLRLAAPHSRSLSAVAACSPMLRATRVAPFCT